MFSQRAHAQVDSCGTICPVVIVAAGPLGGGIGFGSGLSGSPPMPGIFRSLFQGGFLGRRGMREG
jgi:hypothetical protein